MKADRGSRKSFARSVIPPDALRSDDALISHLHSDTVAYDELQRIHALWVLALVPGR